MSELYQLPNGWEIKPISKSIIRIEIGNRPKGGSKDILDGIPSISGEHFGYDGEYKFDNMKYIPIDFFNSLKNGIIEKNVTLVVKDGATTGKSTFLDDTFPFDKAAVNEHTFLIKTDEEQFINKLFFYFTKSHTYLDFINENKNGGTIGGIRKGFVDELLIPTPPLSEQQRIVSKLDLLFEKIDKSIALHQKNMDEADVFMGSVLNDIFGELEEKYEKKQIIELSKKIFAGGDKPEIVSEFPTEELNIPIYANAVKDNGLYGYSNVYKVDEECITISARGTIGFTVVRNEKFLPIVRLIVVIPNEKILSTILKYYLDYQLVENTGSSIPQLTVPTVKEYLIPTPPLNIQQKVVKYLDEISKKIEKVKSVQKEKMDSLKALKASILDRAFRGEL